MNAVSWGQLVLGVRDRIGKLLTSVIGMPGGLWGAVGDLSVLYNCMLESAVDLHPIFKLALVQALNCTYRVHPDLEELGDPRSRCGKFPVSQDLFSYRRKDISGRT